MSTATRKLSGLENGTKSDGKHKTLRFNGVYEAPIDHFGWPGRLLRHKLLHAIVAGSPFLVSFQKLRKPWLDTLMHVLSFMGTEDFYTGIVVLLTWIIDVRFSRLFTILMGIGFYFATSLKNIIRLPRPQSPPVAVLEKTYDWSLPSLHGLIGITLPGYLFFYPYRNYDMTSLEVFILAALVIAWTTSVCASRLYLGVHSPADIVCGLLVGSVVLYLYLQIDDSLDEYFNENHHISLQALIIYSVALSLHPQSGPPTHSFGETAVTSGVAYGMIVAFERTKGPDEWYYAALLEHSGAWKLSVVQVIAISCGKIILGFPLVLLVRFMTKPLCRHAVFTLCHWLGVPSYSYSLFSKSNIQLNKHYNSGFQLPPIHKKERVFEVNSRNDAYHNEVNEYHCVIDGTHQHSSKSQAEMGSWPSAGNGKGSQVTLPLDVDNPTKFVVYCLMSWTSVELLNVLFFHIGLVAHAS